MHSSASTIDITMSTPSSTLSARPHSRALHQRPSSSLSQRPPSSASYARPVSSASLRPQSRVSRPSSRISRPATRQSTRLAPLCQKLITQVAELTLENDEEDFRIALDFVSRNLEHATATKGGPSSDMATMDKRFDGYIQSSYMKVLFSQCMFLQFSRKIPYTVQ
jgi:gamma-tubulin complex component 5